MFGFRDIKKRRLYEQWVDKSGLPDEEIPKDVEQADSSEEGWAGTEEPKYAHDGDSSYLRVKVRYMFFLGFIFALLLIAISVLATILVIQSC